MKLNITLDSSYKEDRELGKHLASNIGGTIFILNINNQDIRFYMNGFTRYTDHKYSCNPKDYFEVSLVGVQDISLPDPKVIAAEQSVKKAEEALQAAKDALKKVKEK